MKKLLILLPILFLACQTIKLPEAVDYSLGVRPKMDIEFYGEGGCYYMRYPTGLVTEIDLETLKYWRDYNADIKAYEAKGNKYLDYYKNLLGVVK